MKEKPNTIFKRFENELDKLEYKINDLSKIDQAFKNLKLAISDIAFEILLTRSYSDFESFFQNDLPKYHSYLGSKIIQISKDIIEKCRDNNFKDFSKLVKNTGIVENDRNMALGDLLYYFFLNHSRSHKDIKSITISNLDREWLEYTIQKFFVEHRKFTLTSKDQSGKYGYTLLGKLVALTQDMYSKTPDIEQKIDWLIERGVPLGHGLLKIALEELLEKLNEDVINYITKNHTNSNCGINIIKHVYYNLRDFKEKLKNPLTERSKNEAMESYKELSKKINLYELDEILVEIVLGGHEDILDLIIRNNEDFHRTINTFKGGYNRFNDEKEKALEKVLYEICDSLHASEFSYESEESIEDNLSITINYRSIAKKLLSVGGLVPKSSWDEEMLEWTNSNDKELIEIATLYNRNNQALERAKKLFNDICNDNYQNAKFDEITLKYLQDIIIDSYDLRTGTSIQSKNLTFVDDIAPISYESFYKNLTELTNKEFIDKILTKYKKETEPFMHFIKLFGDSIYINKYENKYNCLSVSSISKIFDNSLILDRINKINPNEELNQEQNFFIHEVNSIKNYLKGHKIGDTTLEKCVIRNKLENTEFGKKIDNLDVTLENDKVDIPIFLSIKKNDKDNNNINDVNNKSNLDVLGGIDSSSEYSDGE